MLFKEFLTPSKDNYIAINESNQYVVAGLQNYGQGMIGKRKLFGRELTMKKYQVLKENQLMWCKVDTKNGAFSITTQKHVGMIASTNMFVVDIDTQKCVPYLLQLLFSMPFFYNNINEKSLGTTNRKYLKPQEVLSTLEFPDLSIEQQYTLMEKIKRLSNITNVIQTKILQNEKFTSSLRQAILQQAVQGKLCEQDPTDEPASVLLEKIKAEKEKLIAEKKIKKQKELPPVTEEEKPFDLPQGWEWCRLGELSNIYRGSSPRPKGSPLYWTENRTEYYWITISDISNYCVKGFLLDTKEFLTKKGSFLSTFVEKNELIIAVSGSTTGKSCLTAISGYIYDGLACVKTIKGIEKNFLYQFMQYVYQKLNNSKTGSAFPNINTDTLRLLQFPLPPLAEQQRIVEKVDRFMALCDELEQEVTSAKKYASQLMEAVLQEAFSNKQKETQDNVIVFAHQPQQVNARKPILTAAARGNMREETWERITNEAVKLASEES